MSQAYPLARTAAQKALDIDDLLGEADKVLPRYPPTMIGSGSTPTTISGEPSSWTQQRDGASKYLLRSRLYQWHEESLAFAKRSRDVNPCRRLRSCRGR